MCAYFFTGHAHNQVDRCVAAGYDNGDIKLFDLKNMSLRWETNVKNGVSICANFLNYFESIILIFYCQGKFTTILRTDLIEKMI